MNESDMTSTELEELMRDHRKLRRIEVAAKALLAEHPLEPILRALDEAINS